MGSEATRLCAALRKENARLREELASQTIELRQFKGADIHGLYPVCTNDKHRHFLSIGKALPVCPCCAEEDLRARLAKATGLLEKVEPLVTDAYDEGFENGTSVPDHETSDHWWDRSATKDALRAFLAGCESGTATEPQLNGNE